MWLNLKKLRTIFFYIKDNLSSVLLGLMLFVFAFLLIIASATYNPIDLIETKAKINLLGYLGANISDIFLQYFGFTTYFIAFVMFRVSFFTFQKHEIKYYKAKLFAFCVSILCLCFLLGSIKKYEFAFFNPLGGYIGFLLSNLVFEKSFFWSVFIATFICFLACSYFVLELNLIKIKFKTKSVKVPSPATQKDKEDIELNPETIKKPAVRMVAEKIGYTPPSIALLDLNTSENAKKNQKNLSLTKQIEKSLHTALADFGIEAVVKGTKVGPVITMYEIEPKAGIRAARVVGLSEDIARSLKAKSARISIIPSSSSLAVEIPNKERETVFLRALLDSEEYKEANFNIPIALGQSIAGDNVIVDLTTMPHLLVAGTTGSGKSVGVNAMILSILYKLSPLDCQFIMIDPKMLELSVYNDIPHLLTPVITESEKAVMALKWLTIEMERRYRRMSDLSVRNIFGYNDAISKLKNANREQTTQKMPFIVVVIDEMADLMITAGKVIEGYIQRLAQMARAAGIHVIMATQRPSVDVITGVIKANFPTRISYQVSSKIDSRTILGTGGAEGLLGKGDMLYMQAGSKTYRIHAPFVSDNEVNNAVDYLKKSFGGMYSNLQVDIFSEILSEDGEYSEKGTKSEDTGDFKSEDSLYKEAVEIVISENKPSISYIQRRLKIGYNKSANLIERMEKEGLVSKLEPSTGKRMVIKNKG
jgi:S-DNA-T family DNA segregation ATPase FtsK/SpoIIIE